MVGWTLWTLWTYGRYGRYGLDGPIGLYAVYGVYGHRRGVRLTTYELSICENMYTSIRTPSACVSMYVAFSGVLFVRGLFDGLGLFLRSLSKRKKRILLRINESL